MLQLLLLTKNKTQGEKGSYKDNLNVFLSGPLYLRLVQSKLSLTYFRTTAILCQIHTHTHTHHIPKHSKTKKCQPNTVAYTYNSRQTEAEAGQSQVQGQL